MYIEHSSTKALLKEYREGGKVAPKVKAAIIALKPGETIQIRREIEIPRVPHIGGFETLGYPRKGVRRVQYFEIIHRLGAGKRYFSNIIRRFKSTK